MNHTSIFSAFERFNDHLPKESDIVLTILKGHLLIEEQLWLLINHRLTSPKAL
jgi:hypothetical protein